MRRKIFLISLIFIAVIIGISANLYSRREEGKEYTFNTKDIAPEIKGLGGHIEMLVRLNKNGSIKDVKVLSHNESPEYAIGITGPEFLGQFKGKDVNDAFVIGRDIDAVTGATISSKAVADILKACLERIAKIPSPNLANLTRLEKIGLKPREAKYYRVIDE
jgi:Na+-translocating ferredoxin:NAD+ oxidoreductase RnfG subunit